MSGPDDLPDVAAVVLDVVDAVPPGRVATYGDIAEYLTGGSELRAAGRDRIGPRQVGSVLSHWGGASPWWRVVRADGRPAPGHEDRALEHYRAEGTPLRGGARVDLGRARWDGRG